ncbi:MAG: Rpn family recombination-promoting nuclease/putative transposase [Lachnospiraceae bacterium]|nr:Rpn family recombination-promoting nuclease/putative transposase [Lachnospiraceae bacterium]
MPSTQKSIQDLNLADDFLFAKVMEDKEICRKVLEKILGVSIRNVTMPDTQKTLDILYEGKGIRLDVYVNDDKGTVYNVEMQQRSRKGSLPKRTRYYQGSIDLNLISAGEDYEKLRKSFVIFICTFDPFSDGRHVYTFENRCRENPSLVLGDETVKILLNTRGKLDDADEGLLELLAYVEDTTDDFAGRAADPLIREIQTHVNKIKLSKELEVDYMTLLQREREIRKEGREEGREEGMAYGEAKMIIRLYNNGYTLEQIAAVAEKSVDEIREIVERGELGR